MADDTIRVKPGPKLAPGQVAIWDRDEAHPDGEVFLAKPQPDDTEQEPEIEVAETAGVLQALGDGRLARAERRRAPVPPATPSPPPSQTQTAPAGTPAVTDQQRAALATAGFETAEQIRAATDEQLLDVDGIGPATVTRLREATRE